MKTYLDFVEHNDWEGESWHFYIPVAGNEEAIEKFKIIINAINETSGDEYEIGKEMLKEEEVDTLVRFGGQGYYSNHNKLEGKLVIKKLQKALDDDDDPLYKGGITDYMTNDNGEKAD